MFKKILQAMPAAAAALAFLFATQPVQAVEEGLSIYPKGLAGFMSGMLPPQEGLYLGDTYYYFSGSAGREVRDGVVELDVDAKFQADFLQATFVTNWHLLGATFAYGGAVDYAWANIDARFETRIGNLGLRSEERRVGKECRSRWSPYH